MMDLLLPKKISKINYQLIFIIFLIFIGIFFRFYTASFGSNFDFETWNIGPELIKKGISVYTIPDSEPWGRFNWGPIWPYTLYYFKEIAGDNRNLFHYLLTGYLTIVDLCLCIILFKLFGKVVPILYFLSPLTFLITGFHLQFENTALLFAFLGWYLYLQDRKKYFYHTAILFGLSITAKHILILFPVWLFFYEFFILKVNLWKNIFHKSISYLVFFGSFGLEILRHFEDRQNVLNGINKYVFNYNSVDGLSAYAEFLKLLIPFDLIVSFLPSGISYYRLVFLLTLLILGFFVARNIQQKTLLLPLYLLFFFAFGSSLADQYFVIPLVTALIFYRRIESIVFHTLGAVYLATFSLNNIASISNIYHFKLGESFIPIFPYNFREMFTIDQATQRYDSASYTNYYIPQFYLLMMSFFLFLKILKKENLNLSLPNTKTSKYYLIYYALLYGYLMFIIVFRKIIINAN